MFCFISRIAKYIKNLGFKLGFGFEGEGEEVDGGMDVDEGFVMQMSVVGEVGRRGEVGELVMRMG